MRIPSRRIFWTALLLAIVTAGAVAGLGAMRSKSVDAKAAAVVKVPVLEFVFGFEGDVWPEPFGVLYVVMRALL